MPKKLYYFDSSDDESKEDNFYSPLINLKQLDRYLKGSYIFTEIAQSILEQKNVQEKYKNEKASIKDQLITFFPKEVEHEYYVKNKKFLGNI